MPLQALLHPPHLYSAEEVLVRPSPVPACPGVYAWYFRTAPGRTPIDGCHTQTGHKLLYVGISHKSAADQRSAAGKARPGRRYGNPVLNAFRH